MVLQEEIAALMASSANKKGVVSSRVKSCLPIIVGLALAVAFLIVLATGN